MVAISVVSMNYKLTCICFYRPPNSDVSVLEGFLEEIKPLWTLTENLILAGDANLPLVDRTNCCTANRDFSGQMFLDFCMEHGLTQFINEPTHIGGNVLDVVLGSNKYIVDKLQVGAPFSSSDHFIIKFNSPLPVSSNENMTKTRYNYREADFTAFNNFLLRIDWVEQFSCLESVDGYVQFIRGFSSYRS